MHNRYPLIRLGELYLSLIWLAEKLNYIKNWELKIQEFFIFILERDLNYELDY